MKLLLEFNFFSLFLQFFYLLTLNFFKSEFCFIFRTLKEFGVVDFIYFKISCIVINSIFQIVVKSHLTRERKFNDKQIWSLHGQVNFKSWKKNWIYLLWFEYNNVHRETNHSNKSAEVLVVLRPIFQTDVSTIDK